VNFSNGTQIHVSDNIIASLAVDSNVGWVMLYMITRGNFVLDQSAVSFTFLP
jgi:hypothetical protein